MSLREDVARAIGRDVLLDPNNVDPSEWLDAADAALDVVQPLLDVKVKRIREVEEALREIAETGDRWRSADTGMRYSGMIAGPAYEAGSAMAFMNSGDRARRALSGEDAP